MVDLQTVCCMCGDVGFPDKLFRCNKCRRRFQHSYCSNYYMSEYEAIEVCDWCQSESKSNSNSNNSSGSRHGGSSKRSAVVESGVSSRSEYSGDKIKQHVASPVPSDLPSPTAAASDHHHKGKSSTGTPSPRTTTRRYKLLKDVMC